MNIDNDNFANNFILVGYFWKLWISTGSSEIL